MLRLERISAVTGEWECMECGYIEEGTEARRPKQCPECDAPASSLEFFPYDEDEREHDESEEDDEYEDESEDLEDEDYEEDER
jgi:hypothetical protein